MPPFPGMRIGPYEVLSALGKGGMGEVWRARDTRLERDVALKTLPDIFRDDPRRRSRFEHEAKILASLSHPHIAAVYGVAEADGNTVLVLELVEGETLAERLRRGPLAVDEALRLAAQIADALEAAHQHGVVHRDLKPANIQVTGAGTAKLLDFGLAKALQSTAEDESSIAPTRTLSGTRPGAVLGTPAYMSPEQARGEPADERTDVWAFGVVLYEMLTGRSLFDRGTYAETVASILGSGPDLDTLPVSTPLVVRRLLGRCLVKYQADRLRHLDGARLDLLDALSSQHEPKPPPAVGVRTQPWLAWGGWAIATVLLAAVVIAVWRGTGGTPADVTTARFQISAPQVRFAEQSRSLAVSADGALIAYTVDTTFNVYDVRSGETRRLEGLGVNSAWDPFFSPDGQWLGFFEMPAQALRRVPVSGGLAQLLVPRAAANGASWGDDEQIVFTKADGAVYRIAADGGEDTVLAVPADDDTMYAWPDVLPGGRAVLLTVVHRSGTNDGSQVAVLDLDTGVVTTLLQGASNPRYLDSGHIAYVNPNSLAVAGFDAATLSLRDRGSSLDVPVSTTEFGGASFGVSRRGMLAYLPPGPETRRRLVWVDRNGLEEPVAGLPPDHYYLPSMSPDGERVALDMYAPRRAVHLWEVDRALMTPLVRGNLPVWDPDGRRLFVRGDGGNPPSVFAVSADGTGTPEAMTPDDAARVPNSVTPDGSRLLVSLAGRGEVTSLDLRSSTTSSPVDGIPPLTTWPATLSPPDGRWIAYTDPQSQVVVRPFPDVEQGRVVVASGRHPLWAPDGRELYYRGASGNVMAVSVATTRDRFEVGRPRELFPNQGFAPSLGARDYDISPRDGRFLMIKQDDGGAERVFVVLHWFEELRRRTDLAP